MDTPSNKLECQIEAAFDYRGHVTITLSSGEMVEGYIYNREFANPRSAEQHYIDVILKDSDQTRRYAVASIASVQLTGKDCAAGNSFEDYSRKHSGG